jgi:hypothetical protein
MCFCRHLVRCRVNFCRSSSQRASWSGGCSLHQTVREGPPPTPAVPKHKIVYNIRQQVLNKYFCNFLCFILLLGFFNMLGTAAFVSFHSYSCSVIFFIWLCVFCCVCWREGERFRDRPHTRAHSNSNPLQGFGLLISVPFSFAALCFCYHHLIGIVDTPVLTVKTLFYFPNQQNRRTYPCNREPTCNFDQHFEAHMYGVKCQDTESTKEIIQSIWDGCFDC